MVVEVADHLRPNRVWDRDPNVVDCVLRISLKFGVDPDRISYLKRLEWRDMGTNKLRNLGEEDGFLLEYLDAISVAFLD